MLTVIEAATVYPPFGEVPNLENDGVNYGLIAKRLGIRAGGDISLETWDRLVLWSIDPTPRTYVTWAAAVRAASNEPATPSRAGCAPR